ncbi:MULTISPECIES: dimethylmenaquinone methyltransferase [Methylobacterium]|uniref:Dimethylmenaquinone methyltransferase n=1 Tax=Methylobacterium jeotgali TaxID=381630 RepID=A0ABQ4SY64_9HYPH|nr:MULTISPECIES: dimethylmenaquinone methyltransferase [Methylobacterium]PIU04463.1 MAG: dimethylmenaquinone methyltransferase [Methylobacterium sp. CG09_land_8_20_14_0_10_71_15]PIU13784.1 MAG: dimethylmenaquinone methyltransferase [Methylobacterium sp. CG08_land_8_20_14_0_20_71_15]GBU17124.1 ribonuclease activity regulator RraA [Methylobacterium sp.]GJE06606.1 hypothetical protein AOPFMNJM_1928 [Methylobacterium jeotgali]
MSIDPTLRDALLAVPSSGLARVLARRGLSACALRGLRARTGAVAAGPAFTLRFIPARGDAGVSLAEAIEAVPHGAVVVADTGGAREPLPFAAMLSVRLANRGAAGFVTDGTLAGPNVMPVWHGAGAGHGPGLILAGYDQPVACGGAAVHPGDIVVGDADGVLAIPAEITEEVALEAVDQQRLDLWLQREVDSGRPLSGLLPPDAETLERYRTETGQA